MRASVRFLARTLAWLVIVASLAAICVAVLVPRLFGATPYTILTGSMEPGLRPGDLVVIRPVAPEDLSVGDVVTVQLESGVDTVVTHRVYAIQHRADGDLQFITKGDANDTVDRDPRLAVQIRGELWYHVPYLGFVSTALSGSQRSWLAGAVAVGLLGYAGWMFVAAARDRRSARQAATPRRGAEPDLTSAEAAADPADEVAPRRGKRDDQPSEESGLKEVPINE